MLALLWLCAMAPVQAEPLIIDDCSHDIQPLMQWLSIFEDPSAAMTHEQVQMLPQARWKPADAYSLSPSYSQSAFWLSFELSQVQPSSCELYLALGSNRARDIRVYQQDGSGWKVLLGGRQYPFRLWSEQFRLAAFELPLQSGERSRVYIRVASPLSIALQPALFSSDGLLHLRTSESLADGVVFGIVGILVLFSLALGKIFSLRLLIAHAMAVLAYCVQVALINGYGFVYLWPDAPQWDLQAVVLSEMLCRILVLAYLGILLQVSRQPAHYGRLIGLCQGGLALIAVAQFWPAQTNWLDTGGVFYHLISIAMPLVVLAALYRGYRQGLPYTWFSYLLPSLLVLQCLLTYGSVLGWMARSPAEYSWLSVSALPGALLLGYTLVSQVALSRRREKRALADIEQIKQAEQERLEHSVQLRTDQLRESLRAQSMLLARISHDLRSPLQGIISSAQMLGRGANSLNESASTIERIARQQLELIGELLEYSHSELKQLELLVAPGYLYGFLLETQEQGRYLAERNANLLQCRFADDLPLLVNADFRRLRQVLVNLLANAAKFTEQGTIDFSVTCEAGAPPGKVLLRFSVTDSGVGISSTDIEKLQLPFMRTQSAEVYEGSGLGLYIVQQMLERMDSRLMIEPLPVMGSCFSFTLALELADEGALDQVFVESYLQDGDGYGRRILIVDDVAVTREMIYELLAGYGYEPQMCQSAGEALGMLAEQPFDLLITDQMMPDMDGWALLGAVRQRWPQLPVLLYSASPARHPGHVSEHLLFDSVLLKPADTAALLAELERLLPRMDDSCSSAESLCTT